MAFATVIAASSGASGTALAASIDYTPTFPDPGATNTRAFKVEADRLLTAKYGTAWTAAPVRVLPCADQVTFEKYYGGSYYCYTEFGNAHSRRSGKVLFEASSGPGDRYYENVDVSTPYSLRRVRCGRAVDPDDFRNPRWAVSRRASTVSDAHFSGCTDASRVLDAIARRASRGTLRRTNRVVIGENAVFGPTQNPYTCRTSRPSKRVITVQCLTRFDHRMSGTLHRR